MVTVFAAREFWNWNQHGSSREPVPLEVSTTTSFGRGFSQTTTKRLKGSTASAGAASDSKHSSIVSLR